MPRPSARGPGTRAGLCLIAYLPGGKGGNLVFDTEFLFLQFLNVEIVRLRSADFILDRILEGTVLGAKRIDMLGNRH